MRDANSNPPLSEEAVREAVGQLLEPQLQWKVEALNLVKVVEIDDDQLHVALDLVTADPQAIERFRGEAQWALGELAGARTIRLEIGRVDVATEGIRGVRHVVLVASGKGGVGKSSVAVNLAAALRVRGHRVGILDADLYGPSVPTMLGTHERPRVLPEEYLLPVEAHGLKTMSIGYLVARDAAVDWRGNLTSGTLIQFLQKTFWGELDFLIVDLPPGTGDIPLTLAHKLKSDGVVIVTTPQEVALGDVRRALTLFREREIPILGLVENMSHLVCEHCGAHNEPFPASSRSQNGDPGLSIETLARIPLTPELCAAGDEGVPLVLQDRESEAKTALLSLADRIAAALSRTTPAVGLGSASAAPHPSPPA